MCKCNKCNKYPKAIQNVSIEENNSGLYINFPRCRVAWKKPTYPQVFKKSDFNVPEL